MRPGPCELLGVLALLLLAGCLPATARLAPAVEGRVVNRVGDPVAGATVTVAPVSSAADDRAFEVRTDRQGRFRRGERSRWYLAVFVPTDGIAPELEATASRGAARSIPKRFGGGLDHPNFFGVTNIRRAFDLGDLVVYDTPTVP
jgi:hypothetical protein